MASVRCWPTGPVTLAPVMRMRLSDPPLAFGNRWASSALATALGAELGRLVAEFVVTDPRRPRNGRVMRRIRTQNRMGYHGCRTTPRAHRRRTFAGHGAVEPWGRIIPAGRPGPRQPAPGGAAPPDHRGGYWAGSASTRSASTTHPFRTFGSSEASTRAVP